MDKQIKKAKWYSLAIGYIYYDQMKKLYNAAFTSHFSCKWFARAW